MTKNQFEFPTNFRWIGGKETQTLYIRVPYCVARLLLAEVDGDRKRLKTAVVTVEVVE